jgi:hypothetical protein
VSWFQVYALFGSPLLVLGIGLFVYYIAVRGAQKDAERHVPGE